MRSLGRIAASLALAACWVAAASRAGTAPDRGATRAALAEPAREWSEPADFEALRADWAARRDFAARCERDRPVSPAFEAMQAQRWSALLALTEPWSRRCPVDMEAHQLRATALAGLGRMDDAEDAEMWARGLFEAALAQGDGRAPTSPYRVVAEFEEYALLRAFAWVPERQERSADGVDRFVVSRHGDEAEVYFAPLRSPALLAQAAAARGAKH